MNTENYQDKRNELIESLGAFERAYVECALWSSSIYDEDGGSDGNLDDEYGIEDLSIELLEEVISDCQGFQTSLQELRDEAPPELIGLLDKWDDEQAGHDFWLTRNGHGAGFWDRGHGEAGDKLTEIAEVYGNADWYPGDDGLLYC